MLSVKCHNALAGSAACRVYSYAFAERSCEESVGVSFAEVCLGEEGELAEVFNAVDILGFNALFVHEVTVILNVFVNVLYLSHEALALKLFHVLAGHTFNFLVPIFFHWF